jgi:hypothetical protein
MRQLEMRSYGGFGKNLELYISDKYGNVFWDYPKTLRRSFDAALISRYRWQRPTLSESIGL